MKHFRDTHFKIWSILYIFISIWSKDRYPKGGINTMKVQPENDMNISNWLKQKKQLGKWFTGQKRKENEGFFDVFKPYSLQASEIVSFLKLLLSWAVFHLPVELYKNLKQKPIDFNNGSCLCFQEDKESLHCYENNTHGEDSFCSHCL